MKIVIKNPAPRGKQLERWGDFHFGKSLEAALAGQGAEVVQHFWPDWGLHEDEDAIVWLRGKRRCFPRPGVINVAWVLSHPSTLTQAELAGFDVVYAASEMLANELQQLGVQNVEVMRQCTDSRIFKPNLALPDADRLGLLFVASSRGVRRPILDWALEAGLLPSLVGQGWQQVGLGPLVRSGYVDNADLPVLYSSARYGMNDHWGDMAYYQMINNRTFDCLACGLPVITDGFPELAKVAGDGVWIVDSARAFRDAYWSIRLDYAGARQACSSLWDRIGRDYTFDARAREILGRLRSGPTRERGVRQETALSSTAEKAILALLVQAGGLGSDPSKIRRSLLHVMPYRETGSRLSATPSLSVLSAGIGPGAWNISLDADADELGDRKFDVVFIEDETAWARCARREELAARLAEHIKPGGFISASAAGILEPLQSDARLAAISHTPPVYRRTVEHLGRLLDSPAPSSP